MGALGDRSVEMPDGEKSVQQNYYPLCIEREKKISATHLLFVSLHFLSNLLLDVNKKHNGT